MAGPVQVNFKEDQKFTSLQSDGIKDPMLLKQVAGGQYGTLLEDPDVKNKGKSNGKEKGSELRSSMERMNNLKDDYRKNYQYDTFAKNGTVTASKKANKM